MARWWYRKKRSSAWVSWRTKVYKRDGYRCVLCGLGLCRIDPHHILPKSKLPKLRYRVKNGATLCRKCHKKTFRKELDFVETIVEKIYGGMAKWNLMACYLMLKNLKTGSKKLGLPE